MGPSIHCRNSCNLDVLPIPLLFLFMFSNKLWPSLTLSLSAHALDSLTHKKKAAFQNSSMSEYYLVSFLFSDCNINMYIYAMEMKWDACGDLINAVGMG